MIRFPSQEWADAFRAALAKNPDYAKAAAAWEGDILLLVAADAQAPNGEGVLLDLYHGECRSAQFVPDASSIKSEFVFEGKRPDWARVFHRELDPIKALLDGTFRIRGNLAKAMRYTQAARELVDTAARLPAEV